MSLPPLPELILRLVMALVLGAVVGIEREYRSKSAGFRTMMLISLGACLFTMLSISVGGANNPDRIAANIATGVGFLGAGVLFRSNNGINGITTAAAIWAVAAIGMATGAGHYWLGSSAALAMLVVLSMLPFVQRWIDTFHQMRAYTLQMDAGENAIAMQEDRMRSFGLQPKRLSVRCAGGMITAEWHVQGRASDHERYTAAMLQDRQLLSFES